MCLLIFYILGLIFVPMILIMINILALVTSLSSYCKVGCGSEVSPFYIVIAAIGPIMFVMSLAFMIVLQCSMGRMQGAGANQIGTMQPSYSTTNNINTMAY